MLGALLESLGTWGRRPGDSDRVGCAPADERRMADEEIRVGVRVQFRGPEEYYGATAGGWGTVSTVSSPGSFRVDWDNGQDCWVSQDQVWPSGAVRLSGGGEGRRRARDHSYPSLLSLGNIY